MPNMTGKKRKRQKATETGRNHTAKQTVKRTTTKKKPVEKWRICCILFFSLTGVCHSSLGSACFKTASIYPVQCKMKKIRRRLDAFLQSGGEKERERTEIHSSVDSIQMG
jgi:hypothetical protein